MAEGGRPVDRVAARPTPLMSKVFGTRRHSLAFLGALPSILDSIRNEAYLWRQEFDLLRRRTLEGLGGPPRSKIQKPSSRPLRLDAEFASALLKDMELAIPSKSAEYSARYAAIRSKEASAFQQAGACPVDCAIPFENATPAQFSNRKYFDFEAYVRGKALLQEEDVQGPLLMDRIGSTVLAKILLDVDVGDAEAVAIAPTRPMGVDALLSASPDLDSIRRGIRALVKYFRAKGAWFSFSAIGKCSGLLRCHLSTLNNAGFVSGSGIVQFGLSDDEYEVRLRQLSIVCFIHTTLYFVPSNS